MILDTVFKHHPLMVIQISTAWWIPLWAIHGRLLDQVRRY